MYVAYIQLMRMKYYEGKRKIFQLQGLYIINEQKWQAKCNIKKLGGLLRPAFYVSVILLYASARIRIHIPHRS